MIKEIAYFGYAVTDMARSRAFYEGILGLVPDKGSEASEKDNGEFVWAEYSIGSGTLSLGKMADWKPTREGAAIALEVDNFEETVKKLKDAGVEFSTEPMEFDPCHMAIVRDPDGSQIIIHKRK